MDDDLSKFELPGASQLEGGDATAKGAAEKTGQVVEKVIDGLIKIAEWTGVYKLGEPDFYKQSLAILIEASNCGGGKSVLDALWGIVQSMPEKPEEGVEEVPSKQFFAQGSFLKILLFDPAIDNLQYNTGMKELQIVRDSSRKSLLEFGIDLPEQEIRFVVLQVRAGISDTLVFLDRVGTVIPIIHTNEFCGINFNPQESAVDIPRSEFCQWSEQYGIPFSGSEILLDVDPGLIPERIKKPVVRKIALAKHLRIAGREEAVHFFQQEGHPLLKCSIDGSFPVDMLNGKAKYLCDLEVEAREIVDQICIANGEKPWNEEIDKLVQERYPEIYRKSIEWMLENQIKVNRRLIYS